MESSALPDVESSHQGIELTAVKDTNDAKIKPTSDDDKVVAEAVIPATSHNTAEQSFSIEHIFEQGVLKYVDFCSLHGKWILLFWFAIFVICVITGPAFLGKTKSNLTLPKNSESVKAIDEFNKNYPDASTIPVILVVSHIIDGSSSDSIIASSYGNFTRDLSISLNDFCSEYPIVASVTGYWELYNVNPYLASGSVSPSQQTLIETINFQKDTEIEEVNHFIDDIIKWSDEHSTKKIEVEVTGLFALFHEMSTDTEKSFALIDMIVLPVAIIILGSQIKSYRHMGVAIINLVISMLLAFAILVPITEVVDINPFAPSIMMSLGIAINFDYSLFLLTRFYEEVALNKLSTKEAVILCLNASGHVVILSGFTLFITFVLLIAFPQNFLQSVGWSCSCIVLTAMITNVSVTPCLLLTCTCLSRFELCPSANSCCCYVKEGFDDSENSQSNDAAVKTIPDGSKFQGMNVSTGNSVVHPSATSNANNTSQSDYSLAEPADVAKEISDVQQESLSNSNNPEISHSNVGNNDQTQSTLKPSSLFHYFFGWLDYLLNFLNFVRDKIFELILPKGIFEAKRSYWFKISYSTTKYPKSCLLIICLITIPFLIHYTEMVPTSDNELVYLRDSQSLHAYNTVKDDFPIGRMDPYSIIMTTGAPGAIFTPDYFDAEKKVVEFLFDNYDPKYINAHSITAVSYFFGMPIDFTTSQIYLNPDFACLANPQCVQIAGAYRTVVGMLPNSDKSASLIAIETIVDPNSQAVVDLIVTCRDYLRKVSEDDLGGPLDLKAFLFGGYTATLDLQNEVYVVVPYMIAITCVVVLSIVAYNFGSVFISIRLVFTTFVSLIWTYGLMVMVYQPGEAQKAFMVLTPDLKHSSGIYWIIPIMSFSILVGLALDYDIFLINRIIEYRRLGWSDRAAVCLSIEKTADIITTAGVIMAVSFAGLLIPKTTVLNQYGFSLFIGVIFDTFVIRTIVVPVIFAVIDFNYILDPNSKLFGLQINWWPTKMPDIVLTVEEEEEAILTDIWDPKEYKKYSLLAVEKDDKESN